MLTVTDYAIHTVYGCMATGFRLGMGGVAMVLGNLQSRGVLLILIIVRAFCACSRCGWGCLDIFSRVLSFISPSLSGRRPMIARNIVSKGHKLKKRTNGISLTLLITYHFKVVTENTEKNASNVENIPGPPKTSLCCFPQLRIPYYLP